jgi:Fe2+ transport system protein FeoA
LPAKKTTKVTDIDLTEMNRAHRLEAWKQDPNAFVSGRSKEITKLVDNIQGTRAVKNIKSPVFTDGFLSGMKDAKKVPVHDNSKIIRGKAEEYLSSYYGWQGPLRPEYELGETWAIMDTEPYVKQAINRRVALILRNGFAVQGPKKHVEYINKRISNMGFVMEKEFTALLRATLTTLNVQANCFWLKIRSEEASGITKKKGMKPPVAGYVVLPGEMVQPVLKDGVIHKWRRYYETGRWYDDYDPDDIVHFHWDRKPKHIFGTPRITGVRDDIFALRRLEENVELLFINFLFPLFHIKVGTETNPCTWTASGASEIDLIRWELENMPKEGVFVTDERVAIDFVGASDKVLDFSKLIDHYKQRVFTGLGVSPLDMGEGGGANRGEADEISQNLKDSIKADGEAFAEQLKMFVFKEWLREANYSLSIQDTIEDIKFVFHEIDLDTKIKSENHISQIYQMNLITWEESRKAMQTGVIAIDPDQKPNQKDLHFDRETIRQIKETEKAKAEAQKDLISHQTEHAEQQANTQIKLGKAETEHHERKTEASIALTRVKMAHAKVLQKGRQGRPQRATEKKAAPAAKTVRNRNMPANQHGTKTSPKRKSDAEIAQLFRPYLESPPSEATLLDILVGSTEYKELIDSEEQNDYTNQTRRQIEILVQAVQDCANSEELAILLDNWGLNAE